jgi:hypothetical protein
VKLTIPRRGERRILYQFPVMPELTAWIEGNGKPMSSQRSSLMTSSMKMMIVSVLMTSTGDEAHEQRAKDRAATGGAGELGAPFVLDAGRPAVCWDLTE